MDCVVVMRFCLFFCSYDPRENTWSILAEMNTPRALAGCAVFRNKIYVIGEVLLEIHIVLLHYVCFK